MTAPTVHGDEVLVGTPDGLWAIAGDSGLPRWHLSRQAVGAVDLPPAILNGTAYLVGQGWIGSDVPYARNQAAYAIHLDGSPLIAPTLTTTPGRLRHWPWIAAAAALAGLFVAAIGRPHAPARRRRWPDALLAAFMLSAAGIVAGWGIQHHPILQPADVNYSASPAPFVYAGPVPAAMLASAVCLVYAAAWLAIWRGRKLAVAAILSLALVAAMATLWVRGRRAEERIHLTTFELRPDRVQRFDFGLISALGGLRFEWHESGSPMADGMFKARNTPPFSWSRTFTPPVYPAQGPIRSADEQGTARQWYGFESRKWTSKSVWDPGPTAVSASVTVPDWSLLAPACVFPAVLLVRMSLRWRNRRRSRTGRCPNCSYSLTGNVSGICPECGTPTPSCHTSPTEAVAAPDISP